MIRTNTASLLDFLIGKECLMPYTIPTVISAFINQPRLVKLLPDIAHRAHMMRIGSTDEIGILGVFSIHQYLEVLMRLINVLLRRQVLFGSFGSNFIAMLVRSNLKTNVFTFLLLIARPNIRQQIIKRIADMRLAINIRNCSGNV